MATTINDTMHAGLGAAASTSRGIAERYRNWAERRRQAARIRFELNCYTDRQLADLGMVRSDIPDVANGRFRRA